MKNRIYIGRYVLFAVILPLVAVFALILSDEVLGLLFKAGFFVEAGNYAAYVVVSTYILALSGTFLATKMISKKWRDARSMEMFVKNRNFKFWLFYIFVLTLFILYIIGGAVMMMTIPLFYMGVVALIAGVFGFFSLSRFIN